MFSNLSIFNLKKEKEKQQLKINAIGTSPLFGDSFF